jgi:DNA (cytosine-5)-methyltransferase 1
MYDEKAKTYSIDQGGGKSACNVLEEQSPTLTTTHDGAPAVYNISSYESNAMKSNNPHSGIYKARASRTLDLNGGNPNCNQGGTIILENHPQDSRNVPMVMEPYTSSKASYHQKFTNDGKAETLLASDYKDPQCVVYANEAYDKWSESEKGTTLKASGGMHNGGSENLSVNYTVRRLTPLECERLQGFPDNWTNIGEWIDSKGKKHKDADSPRYKALGNSIALPFWQWMADRMAKVLKEDGVQLPTMASLFDGIGGFPLVYSRCGCKPIWASEIEEFPMAVTKIRFPEVDYESSNHNKRE